ncbi:Transmembrane protein adipocyte-associated 1 homolog [Eumeta japonica]|uniref:Transmembrane protein adipocyte-associated 1 homolog n=1 Tax=Eumeta variegata TaxID=151549 RepID=A0A4C1TIF0_EUMVA|nr:Transmembrane protein adipocyte-associated 1 homolog [Eumeta japonica]
MTVNAAVPLGGLADKILWVMVRFFLLATEMSVVIFGLAFGHLDSRSSIRYVLLVTSLISLAYTIPQGTLEIMMPDDIFHIDTRDYDLFGHGGMTFLFSSSLVFAIIYFIILLLPWTSLRDYLALPTKLSFYIYVVVLALNDATQAAGAAMLAWGGVPCGLCIIDVTTWLYFSLYTPLVYHTFLSEFFSVSQPSIMFSYKAQMDEPLDDEQVSLPHQQSFSSLKTDSDYIYQQSNSVYDSTLFEGGGGRAYSASLQSPDSIASTHSLDLKPHT